MIKFPSKGRRENFVYHAESDYGYISEIKITEKLLAKQSFICLFS
jgi:hypothetical protein